MTQYAILVGIGKYEDTQITDLEFAENDAKSFRECLITQVNFPEKNVHVFTSERGYNYAAHTAIMRKFSQLCRQANPEDTFLFYFAGHGVEKNDGAYLMTANTEMYSPVLFRASAISVQFLQEEMRLSKAANRIFIIDACRNNPEKGRGDEDNLLTDRFSREIMIATRCRPADAVAPNTASLFACNKGERAYEWHEKKHGVFSYYLMEGITQIEKEHGSSDLGSLGNYVREKVSEWCVGNLSHDKRQTPWLIVDGGVPRLFMKQSRTKKKSDDFVRCPLCGGYNEKTATFLCKYCGQDYLCRSHQDQKKWVCMVCAEEQQKETCPVCKAQNEVGNTFDCSECGKTHLCLSHRSPDQRLCSDCFVKLEKQKQEDIIRQERRAFDEAVKMNTIAGWEGFLSLYPKGKYLKEAVKELSALKEQHTPKDKQTTFEKEVSTKKSNRTFLFLFVIGFIGFVFLVIALQPETPREKQIEQPAVREKQIEQPAVREKQISNTLGMTFVYIEPGSFIMGSPKDEPGRDDDETQHRVTLTKGFYMQTTEVTVGQWKKFIQATNYKTEAEKGDGAYVWVDGQWGMKSDANWRNPYFSQTDDHPVVCVSWNDVQEFIKKLNQKEGTKAYRLPTEAEWEYAARAGTTTPFSFGNCLSTDQANYDGNNPLSGCPKGKYREKTVPAGSFPANAWGLYDMHGNVLEWCSDWYGPYPTIAVTDPAGPSTGSDRVLRGGSWGSYARYCRSAGRYNGYPSGGFNYIGFRLARSLGQQ